VELCSGRSYELAGRVIEQEVGDADAGVGSSDPAEHALFGEAGVGADVGVPAHTCAERLGRGTLRRHGRGAHKARVGRACVSGPSLHSRWRSAEETIRARRHLPRKPGQTRRRAGCRAARKGVGARKRADERATHRVDMAAAGADAVRCWDRPPKRCINCSAATFSTPCLASQLHVAISLHCTVNRRPFIYRQST
jgi:hypothetical protein